MIATTLLQNIEKLKKAVNAKPYDLFYINKLIKDIVTQIQTMEKPQQEASDFSFWRKNLDY